MLKRWIGYLLAVTCCLVFYWAHGQWMSYMILLALLGLPAVSLLISLPAMIKTRLECGLPDRITMEQEASAAIAPQGPKVFPPWRVKARISHNFTGLRRSLLPGHMLPAQHCGQIRVTVKYARVYDHLGLFFLKKPMPKEHTITVLPLPQRPARIPDTSSCPGVRLYPRPAGGFADRMDTVKHIATGKQQRLCGYKCFSVRQYDTPGMGEATAAFEIGFDHFQFNIHKSTSLFT